MLYTSKESLEHVEFRFRIKKYDLLKKTTIFEIFPIFIQRGTLWCQSEKFTFFEFSKFPNLFLKNGFKGS